MNILETIVAAKREELAERKRVRPLESFRGNVVPSDRDFYGALERRRRAGVPAFILECKKASPSQGLIRADFDPGAIADVYARRADAVSVLCDEKFFQGRYENLPLVRARLAQPVLAKEFVVDPYQIFLARSLGADAVLLMLSVLDDATYSGLAALAHSLGMGVLTEADSADDVRRANALGARVIGINNRNLRTLETDVARTRELSAAVRADAVRVAESGIRSHADALATAPFADAFLVGTSLMRERDLDRACRALILGENKVCGLTRAEDARAARDAGAVFGGLIFAEKSPRRVSRERAAEIVSGTPGLDFVGVFQNQPLETVAETAARLGLRVVQLHGEEDADFAARLREKLPAGTRVWKALSADAADAFRAGASDAAVFDRFVLDSGRGGTGTPFDWGKIPAETKRRALLAGGISPENARVAHRVGCLGLDFNSGVESAPGVKSAEKIRAAFEAVRSF